MPPPLRVVDVALEIYSWLLFGFAVIELLTGFSVVSRKNHVAVAVRRFLTPVVEPALRPTRYVFRPIAGIDASPVILIVLILLVRYLVLIFVLRPSH